MIRATYRFLVKTRKRFKRLISPANWGNFRSLKPVSKVYGLDRGKSVDRYYIEKFIEKNKTSITGKCLEVADSKYTSDYGKKVTISDVLDIDPKNKYATVRSDLRNAKNIKSNYYDCIILTQVLQYIDALEAVAKECYRILRPKGTILITVPTMSRVDVATGIKGDYWRFTEASIHYLFDPVFSRKNVKVESFGNVLSGTAFWQGIALEELTQEELDFQDPNFPIIITVKLSK